MNRSVAMLFLPGFPWHLEDAMPQRVMGSCASSLACEGLRPLALDFGTPATLAALERSPQESPRGPHNEALAYDLARHAFSTLLAHGSPDLVVLIVERRKDVLPAREFARLARAAGLGCPVVLAGSYAASYGGLLMEVEGFV